MMEVELQAALISAVGVVSAALVGVIGITSVLSLRAYIRILCDEVERYHAIEGRLIEDILRKDGRDVTQSLVKNKRGELRSKYSESQESRPNMTPRDIQRLRRKFLIL